MGRFRLILGKVPAALAEIPDDSIDAVVTDTPYHLHSIVRRFGKANSAPVDQSAGLFARSARGFMGQEWDGGDVAFRPETWAEVLRVAKPGANLAAFGGARTVHHMAVAIEEAGWEVRHGMRVIASMWEEIEAFAAELTPGQRIRFVRIIERLMAKELAWVYSTGAPKGNVELPGKLGTILAPAFEPIVLARKPISEGSVAAQVRETGTGGLNIEACRSDRSDYGISGDEPARQAQICYGAYNGQRPAYDRVEIGRWPKTVVLDGSKEVEMAFPFNEGGSAARFYYSDKATTEDREEGLHDAEDKVLRRVNAGGLENDPKYAPVVRKNSHPTCKPTPAMRWLVKLVTPPRVDDRPAPEILDPFMGSGSTGKAAMLEGFRFVGVEMGAEFLEIARKRIEWAEREAIEQAAEMAEHTGQPSLFKAAK